MSHYHPLTLEAMARERRQALLREADAHRLAKQARQGQPGLATRMRQELGGLLVQTGKRMKEGRIPQGNNTLGWAEE